jgi:hypothetical protein
VAGTPRAFLGTLLRIVVLLGLSIVVSAWIFRTDMRESSRFAPVGVIEFSLPEGRSRGTAFLVGDCAVMTNFHVAFGPWYLTALRPPSSSNRGTFTLSQATLADGEHPASEAVPVIWGDYTGPDRQLRKPGEDWVVLALKDCLGTRFGYLKPYDAALNDDVPGEGGFAAVGYSSGRQMVDANCSIRMDGKNRNGSTMLHDCAALLGDSGSPIMRRGTGRVVAMVSSFHADWSSSRCRSPTGFVREQWTSECTNVAVPFDAGLIDRIEAVREAILVQNQLLNLGYDAGPLGEIEAPRLVRAIKQFQVDSGLAPNGAIDANLCKRLKMRTLRL